MSDKIVDKVKKRITDLDQAIQRLDFVKRHLNQNSSEIKTQIHTSISGHLETLRKREVWLLEQVDRVLVEKEVVLQRQQAGLNKALGVLHSSLSHASHTAHTDHTATTRLAHALQELADIELRAEETPYIAFRADQVALRESILSYGRVDAHGMPLLSAFADEDKPSASLPRHVEDYEDSQHHLFYKALQDSKTTSASICVALPKLSSRVEDWLQKPMLQLTSEVLAPTPTTSTPDTASTPLSQTTCAIQSWLADIKHNPDLEDDHDFEIVHHSSSSHRESPMEEEENLGVQPLDDGDLLGMMSHISRDQHQWLQCGGGRASGTTQEDLHAFFKHIPQDTSVWLGTARRQLESLEDLKKGGLFRHIPTDTATWLKRAHEKRTVAHQDMFAHIPRDTTVWLNSATPGAGQQMDIMDETLEEETKGQTFISLPPLSTFVKKTLTSDPSMTSEPVSLNSEPPLTREPVSVMYESVSQDSCLLQSGLNSSLSVCGGEEDFSLPGLAQYNCSSSQWLPNARKEKHLPPPPSIPAAFAHISSNTADWLLSERGQQKSPSQAIRLPCYSKDCLMSQWLQPESASLTEHCLPSPASPLDRLTRGLGHLSTADWLLGSDRQENDGGESMQSWRVLPDSPQTSGLSLVTSGHHIPALDLSSWIYQNSL